MSDAPDVEEIARQLGNAGRSAWRHAGERAVLFYSPVSRRKSVEMGLCDKDWLINSVRMNGLLHFPATPTPLGLKVQGYLAGKKNVG